MKTQRIGDFVEKILQLEQLTTIEILDRVNNHFRHGSSRHQLGNVLSKDIRFQKLEMVKLRGFISGSTYNAKWGLKGGM